MTAAYLVADSHAELEVKVPSEGALSATFAALADPTRRAILARLSAGETNVTELASPFDMTLPAITKHLKVLEHAGLISRSRVAQARHCHIEPEPLRLATDWMVQCRHMWEERLDRLDAFLQMQRALAASGQNPPPLLALPTPAEKTAKTPKSRKTRIKNKPPR